MLPKRGPGKVVAVAGGEVAEVGVAEARTRAAPGDAAVEGSGASVLESWPYLCDAFLCAAVHDGVGQYFDNNHLTNSAARRMHALFAPVFDGGRP